MKLFAVFLSCLIVCSNAFPKIQENSVVLPKDLEIHLHMLEGIIDGITNIFPKIRENSVALPKGFEIHLHMLEGIIDELKNIFDQFDPVNEEDAAPLDVLGYFLKVHNAQIEGFSNILRDVILHLDIPVIAVSFSLELPEIFGNIEQWESNIPEIHGKGSFNFRITNTKLFIRMGVNLFGRGLEPMQFKSSIESANVTITGLHDNEEGSQQFSDTINSLLNDSVNDPQIHKVIGEIIDVIIDGVLSSR